MRSLLKKSWIFPAWLWLLMTAFSILKIWLVRSQHLFAIGFADKDDRLFINLADSLLHHHWLGPYNSMTLAKGPFFSLWLALNNVIGLPLLTGEQILYVLACLVTVVALRPILKKNWQSLILFLALVFNPITFNAPLMTRVIREGLYVSLTLLVVATFIGLAVRAREKVSAVVPWSIGAGMALASLWLTREEGPWILPTIILLLGFFLYQGMRDRQSNWLKNLLLATTPFLILWVAVSTVTQVNLRQYGVPTTVEFKSTDFLDAYGAMTRVKSDDWYPFVPVTRSARMKMYEVSPTFAAVKPFLDSPNNPWIKISNENTGQNIQEIAGGWFMWSFRDTVADAGFYKDGETAMSFYRRMAAEINGACDTGRLDCLPKRSTMISPWRTEYLEPLKKQFINAWPYLIRYDDLSVISPLSSGDNFSLELFSRITNETIYPDTLPDRRVAINTKIIDLQRSIFPVLAIVAIGVALYSVIRRRNGTVLWLVFAISASIVIRVALLSLISVSSFPSNNWLYFSCLYPLISLVVVLPLLVVFDKRPPAA